MVKSAPGTWMSPGCDGDDARKSERQEKQTGAKESVWKCVCVCVLSVSTACVVVISQFMVASVAFSMLSHLPVPQSLLSGYSSKTFFASLKNMSVNSRLRLNLSVSLKVSPKNSPHTVSHHCLSSSGSRARAPTLLANHVALLLLSHVVLQPFRIFHLIKCAPTDCRRQSWRMRTLQVETCTDTRCSASVFTDKWSPSAQQLAPHGSRSTQETIIAFCQMDFTLNEPG